MMFSLGQFQDLRKVRQYKEDEEGSQSHRESLILCLFYFVSCFFRGLAEWQREIGEELWFGRVGRVQVRNVKSH